MSFFKKYFALVFVLFLFFSGSIYGEAFVCNISNPAPSDSGYTWQVESSICGSAGSSGSPSCGWSGPDICRSSTLNQNGSFWEYFGPTNDLIYCNTSYRCSLLPSPPTNPSVKISADRNFIQAGSSVKISWNSSFTNFCNLFENNNTIFQHGPTSGSYSHLPQSNTTYRVSCQSNNGTGFVEDTVSVGVKYSTNPSVQATANPTQIFSGGISYINYSSQNSTSCMIQNTTTWPYIMLERYCPTSGVYSTGPLNSNPSSNREYKYRITCGNGSSYIGNPTAGCPAVEEQEGGETIVNYLERFKNYFLKIIPQAFADIIQDAYSEVSVIVKPTSLPITVFLSKPPERAKNVVKRGTQKPISYGYLVGIINNITGTGVSCSLHNITTNTIESTHYSNLSNTSIPNIDGVMVTNNQDIYQIICSNGSSSEQVSFFGQSGTLNIASGPSSCTIPAGSSSCSLPLSWSTINPKESQNVFIWNGVNTNLNSSGTNQGFSFGGGAMSIGGTSATSNLVMTNKVDGETTGSTVINILASNGITVSCAPGSTWNGTICQATPAVPTGLSATTGTCATSTGQGQINVSWNSVGGATSYELRDQSNLIYNGPNTSFTHSFLVLGSSNSYTVRACNSGNCSA